MEAPATALGLHKHGHKHGPSHRSVGEPFDTNSSMLRGDWTGHTAPLTVIRTIMLVPIGFSVARHSRLPGLTGRQSTDG